MGEVVVAEGYSFGDHVVDLAPVGKSSQVAVVDEEVGFQFARGGRGVLTFVEVLGVIAVHGIELQAAAAAPIHGILQQLAFPYRPKYQGVIVGLKAFQRFHGERYLFAYLGVLVLDDGPVKVNRYDHLLKVLCCVLGNSWGLAPAAIG